MEFSKWLHSIANEDRAVYIKRLSANDTGATSSHQVGIYFPKDVLGSVFPSLNTQDERNPEVLFKAIVESDGAPEQKLRAVYYNQKTRNEKRITCWKKGVGYSPLQDPEKTGSIALFAFAKSSCDSAFMKAWVCRNVEEEDLLERYVGAIDPQTTYFKAGERLFENSLPSVSIKAESYPEAWNHAFPSGSEMVDFLLEKQLYAHLEVDQRIMRRRAHEFRLFKLVEQHHTVCLIQKGFKDVEKFMSLANSVSNRRKARSGRSLELHLERIFREEGMECFGVQCKTEGEKTTDFLFPNCASYHDPCYPVEKLRMLAVKTTVKDRWRQILNEASRLDTAYLFTLQEGVSVNQFREMQQEGVRLVVPSPLHRSFPKEIRGDLYSLDEFIREAKLTCW